MSDPLEEILQQWRQAMPQRDAAEVEEQSAPVDEHQQPAVAQEEQPPAPEEEKSDDGYYRLSKADLYRDIARLAEEDERFRNILQTFQGRRAARRYESEIAQLRAELERTKRELFAQRLQAMSEEDIAQRAEQDEEFREQLEWYVGAEEADPKQEQETALWRTKVEEAFDWAMAEGLPPSRIDQIRTALRPGGCVNCKVWPGIPHGVLDHDREGNPVWEGDAVDMLRSALAAEVVALRQARSSAPPPQAAQTSSPAPVASQGKPEVPEPRTMLPVQRDTAAPDMSPPGGGQEMGVMTLEEVYRLPPPEFVRLFPNEGDLERAIAAGRVVRKR